MGSSVRLKRGHPAPRSESSLLQILCSKRSQVGRRQIGAVLGGPPGPLLGSLKRSVGRGGRWRRLGGRRTCPGFLCASPVETQTGPVTPPSSPFETQTLLLETQTRAVETQNGRRG